MATSNTISFGSAQAPASCGGEYSSEFMVKVRMGCKIGMERRTRRKGRTLYLPRISIISNKPRRATGATRLAIRGYRDPSWLLTVVPAVTLSSGVVCVNGSVVYIVVVLGPNLSRSRLTNPSASYSTEHESEALGPFPQHPWCRNYTHSFSATSVISCRTSFLLTPPSPSQP